VTPSCNRASITVTKRLLSLELGQYSEELALTCADGSTQSLHWEGAIPFVLQPLLQSYPRLLDLTGDSLAGEELSGSGQAYKPALNSLHLIMQYPEELVPKLILVWKSADPSWSSVAEKASADIFPLMRQPHLTMPSSSAVPVSFDPPLPAGIAYLGNQIPPSGVYSSNQLDALAKLFQDQVSGLLNARGKKQILQYARQRVADGMPDTIATPYQVPCGQPGGPMQYCSGVQVSSNHQKHALLAQYDQGITAAQQQESALLAFDLTVFSSPQTSQK
jgi:hypothetical protein